jgi:hypothetical protein
MFRGMAETKVPARQVDPAEKCRGILRRAAQYVSEFGQHGLVSPCGASPERRQQRWRCRLCLGGSESVVPP